MLDDDSYWLINGLVLAGPWPRSFDRLQLAGVTVIVNLTEREYQDERFTVRSIPVTDYLGPELEQVAELVDLVADAERAGDRVYLHCLAGCGRTGLLRQLQDRVALCIVVEVLPHRLVPAVQVIALAVNPVVELSES